MVLKLLEIKKAKKIVFVGDTHGDLEASQRVIKDYLPARNASHSDAGGKPGNKIVFLGDYVDRGPFSKENLDFLLEQREKHPEQVFLLQGNHEGHRFLKFSPAEFWESLGEKDYEKYCSIVESFPLAIVTNDIIVLHGVLPDVKNLSGINEIKNGDENWFKICWGDFYDEPGADLGIDIFTGRPQFGRDYFFKLMERFDKKILIRSHQPDAPQFMFNDRCLTIFTSSAYTRERLQPAHHPPTSAEAGPSIAILDFKKEINSARDLEIRKI